MQPRGNLTAVQGDAGRLLPLPAVGDLQRMDPDAWEALYAGSRPPLWRFARARLATADQAEDAVSETMVRAMSAVARYRSGPGGLIAWLMGIERNVINEMYRAGRRHRAVPAAVEPAAPEPTDRMVAAAEASAVRAAFAELPFDDQELLGLRVVARLDTESTAKVLGKRPGAIRMAQARALGRLRVSMREVSP